ncbi:MAG: hypothetical protein ABIP20_18330 [Chthoniobacteraceae bacterium]
MLIYASTLLSIDLCDQNVSRAMLEAITVRLKISISDKGLSNFTRREMRDVLTLNAKPLHGSRTHFRGSFPEGLEIVLCRRSGADNGRFGGAERARHATALRAVAAADSGTGDRGSAPVCGRGGDRRERLRGAGGKTPVIGLLQRGGKVFAAIVENCSTQALVPSIRGQVLSAATACTYYRIEFVHGLPTALSGHGCFWVRVAWSLPSLP